MPRLGLAGLWIFGLLAFVSPLAVSAGGLLMLLALLLNRREWAALRRPSVVLSLVFAVYVLARGWAAMNAYPEWRGEVADYTAGWVWLAFWIVPAFWMAQRRDADKLVLLLALIGLLVGSFVSLHEHQSSLLAADRDDFRIRPITLSLICGFLLLAIWTYVPPLWRHVADRGLVARWTVAAGMLLCSAVLIQIVIRAKSRGAWLAIVITAGLYGAWLWTRGSPRATRLKLAAGAAVLALAAVLVALNAQYVMKKLTFERRATEVLLQEGLEAAPVTSMTHRLALWDFALETLPDHPLFGVGPKVGEYLTRDHPNPKLHDPEHGNAPFEHFHNFFVQILMDFGLVGLVLFCGLVVALLREAISAVRAGMGDPVRLAFVILALVMTVVWSMFDFRAIRWDWRGFWFLLTGSMFYIGARVPARRA